MIALQTLGGVGLRNDGKEVATILAQPKRLALLVYLATARPRGFHSRDTLLALFWPESDDERARNSLRQALHHLRRSLGEASIAGRGDREVGIDASLVRCDAAEFDEAVEAGRWEDALTLYRGDFLPGLFVHDSPGVERWIDDERSRRRRDAIAAAWRLAEAAERAGDARAAEGWARMAVAFDPEDDTAELRLATVVDRMRARAAESAMASASSVPSARPASSAKATPATSIQSAATAEGRGPRACPSGVAPGSSPPPCSASSPPAGCSIRGRAVPRSPRRRRSPSSPSST